MIIQSIADREYHRACLEPVEAELIARGHTILRKDRKGYQKDGVDATITASVTHLNPPHVNRIKRPVFFLPHGVAVVKTTLYKFHTNADYMLMTGPAWKERMEFLFPKYQNNIEVGFPKSDELVKGKSTRKEVIQELGLDPKEPIIVYAPSWDSKDAKRKGTIDALPSILSLKLKNLILCLHEYDKMFDKLEGKNIVKAANKNRYLLAADLLIGDISSMMIEFTILNKPMVHIDMYGDRRMYGVWEESVNHYGTFQVGEFAAPDGIGKAIDSALKNPDKFKHLRDYWKWRSFYNLGKATKAAADRIEELTASYVPRPKRFFFFKEEY